MPAERLIPTGDAAKALGVDHGTLFAGGNAVWSHPKS